MTRDIEIYLFHSQDSVVIGFFRNDKNLRNVFVNKQSLGEELVEAFSSALNHLNISLDNIESLYLNSSFSTWNASRLVTLFSKTIVSFSHIKLYSSQESHDKYDVEGALRNFSKSKANFRLISDVDSVEPLYKKCANIDI